MSDATIIEGEEFEPLQVGIGALMVDGQVALDPRIAERGYLNVALAKGQFVFRAGRYVGLIPINSKLSIRIRPRAEIANIAHMIVRSGIAPTAIVDFSRGYLPDFATGLNAEQAYYAPLIAGIERILSSGMLKSYVRIDDPPAWRGRLLVSDTIRRHRARNVRYRGEFHYMTLSFAGVENIALKHSLKIVRDWLLRQKDKKFVPFLTRAKVVLEKMGSIPDVQRDLGHVVQQIGRSAGRLPLQYSYYQDPLWTAYLLLQKKLPDLSTEGFVKLDSLIIDLSKVFEAYVRTTLVERAEEHGWRIVDGNLKPFSFFYQDSTYSVHPDIVVVVDGKPRAVIDAKYKPELKEDDRYEVLSFMDTVGVVRGGFVCPQWPNASSRFMGRTSSGKELSLLRFDLAAADLEMEATRFADNVARLIQSNHAYT